ncbi:MAG: polyprenyl synthetase family protein [Opitutaceae bacterium]
MSTTTATDSNTAPLEFSSVFADLTPHVEALNACLRDQVAQFEPEIREMADYCIDTSGKRIRPALVFLSGWQDEAVNPELVRVAAVIELVHLATLVHDDIMDGADIRRGRESATRSFGPEAAVLLGDALFAHALHLAAQFPTTLVCSAVAESTRRVCAGEIIQTLRRGTTTVSREDYQRVIDLKTAELFRVSCYLGSHLAEFSEDYVTAVTVFGRQLGIAYQIYDDLADFFGQESKIGKTLGTDLGSGKLTLPLMELIEASPENERASILAEITGDRAPQPELRVTQMRELGIFGRVESALEQELFIAESALDQHVDLPPVPRLLSLISILRSQVASLRPNIKGKLPVGGT